VDLGYSSASLRRRFSRGAAAPTAGRSPSRRSG
jgi:hypothetical protein